MFMSTTEPIIHRRHQNIGQRQISCRTMIQRRLVLMPVPLLLLYYHYVSTVNHRRLLHGKSQTIPTSYAPTPTARPRSRDTRPRLTVADMSTAATGIWWEADRLRRKLLLAVTATIAPQALLPVCQINCSTKRWARVPTGKMWIHPTAQSLTQIKWCRNWRMKMPKKRDSL